MRVLGKDSRLSDREKGMLLAQMPVVTLVLAYFFYDSAWTALFLWPFGVLWLYRACKKKENDRKEKFQGQFKEGLLSVAAGLRAGYAVENAFREAWTDLARLYGTNSDITIAWGRIVRGIANNLPIEKLLAEFAQDSGLREAEEFAEIFAIAKKGGGNLSEIIRNTADVISEKIGTEREISVVIASKKMEFRIMTAVPFAIVLYISAMSPGYFDVLYEDLTGKLIMTFCLMVYVLAWILGEKLTDIHI